MSPTGSYLEIDGRPALRFVREYAHAADRVFALLTDPSELVHWFPAQVTATSWDVGAALAFTFGTDGDGGTGEVLAHDPPRRVAFTWDGEELRFDVETLRDGRTRLTFTHLMQERDGAARNAAGWDLCLDALDAAASGTPTSAPGGRTPAWETLYEGYVAAGVPSGAPIPG
ncbi:SRPBCC domain-containing protein [Actinomycetospora sp. C-140]